MELVEKIDHGMVQRMTVVLNKCLKDAEGQSLNPALLVEGLFEHSLLWRNASDRQATGAPGLLQALNLAGRDSAEHFARGVLPVMLVAAETYIATQNDAPLPIIGRNTPDSRSFTQYECFQILSAAFLCLFPRRSADCTAEDDRDLPSINFDEMHRCGESVEVQRLIMWLDYFRCLARRVQLKDDTIWTNKVTILRIRSDPQQALQDRPLVPAVMHRLGESIDDQDSMLKIDFANMMIGGASLSFGCVQEEITFSVCPELNVARLYHRPMADQEAIVLLNAQRYSQLKHGTYGRSMAYGGPSAYCKSSTETPSSGFTPNGIIALDALDLRFLPAAFQYTANGIDRELAKCLSGLSFDGAVYGLAADTNMQVATGNWGCGVFRGDAELKLLIQWIACSLTGRAMHYFPFDRADLFARFPAVQDILLSRNVSAMSLLQALRTKLDSKAAAGRVWSIVSELFGAPSQRER